MNADLWHAVPGQPMAVGHLIDAVARPVHAYLFSGPPGSGKRSAARAFAAALLCPNGGDGTCRDCRLALAGEHPDVHEVERVGPAISADQARQIVRLASLTPVEGDRKVLILDEFHLLAEAAAAILLKTVEEPPPSTTFVILADDVPPELVTIASRCARIEFRPVPHDVVVAVLEREGHPPESAALAADGAAGNLDRARVLAADPMAAARREAFRHVSTRLDDTGATVAAAVDELLGLIDASLEPLKERQAAESAELDERTVQLGERRSDRKELEERHRRELRRYRTDELRAGLVTLAASYRDRLAAATMPDPAAGLAAVAMVAEAIEAMERNPNERLLLETLLLRLPGV